MAMEESFLKSVFHGVIPEEMVFPYPEPGREQREHIGLILDGVRGFARKHVDAGAIDQAAEIPEQVFQYSAQIIHVAEGLRVKAQWTVPLSGRFL